MHDHKKPRAFDPADEPAVAVYRVTAGFPREELYGLIQVNRHSALIKPEIVETEKVLNGLIRALRDN